MSNDVHVAMMNLLWPKVGLARSMFYEYWSGAHTQISSRLPGIHQYFQHHLDADAGQMFPGAVKFSDREARPGFFGDAEITFATADDLTDFVGALAPLMEDEQNVFDKTISYQADGANVATLKDEMLDDSPNGDLGTYEKFMLYLRRDPISGEDRFRAAVRRAAEALAASNDVAKSRYRLVNRYDNESVTLLAPNVSNIETEDAQVQACVEVVFYDALARRRYGASPLSKEVSALLGDVTASIHPTRALRTYTVYNHGRITLAGLRTPQMAAQIRAIGALNQTEAMTRRLMMAAHTAAAASD